MRPPMLQIHALHKRFGATDIIRGLSLEVHAGERHALIGPNGAGKSTLFHLISGLFVPSGGSVTLKGQEIAGMAAHKINRLGLSRSFQMTSLFPRLSVFENLRISIMARHGCRFGLLRFAAHQRAIQRDTEALLEQIRLGAVRNKRVGDLTYSEQRALEIGMALGSGGEVILLDEPTAGMSADESMMMVDLVRQVTHDKTLLIIEHDMDVVFALADRISVLVYGEIIATDTPQAIQHNPAVQQAYLGWELA